MTQNGKIETATGDLLASGFADFLNDGSFDSETETFRTDVPYPAKVRGQRGETQMHRWDGMNWILAPQPAKTRITFQASSKMVDDEIPLVAGFQRLGGEVTTPKFFIKNLIEAVRRAVGEVRAVGTGAKLQIVEYKKGGTPEEVVMGTFDIPDTQGLYESFEFSTTTPPRDGRNRYELQGDLGTASSAAVRFTSMWLLRVET